MQTRSPFAGTYAVWFGATTYRELRRYRHIYPNVYQRPDTVLTATDRAVAAWLWSDGRAVVAGSSAAALLGAKWVDPSEPAELITSRTRPPPQLVTRNETLFVGETIVVDEMLVTSPARTAFDIGRHASPELAVVRIDALAGATGLRRSDVLPLMQTHRGARGMKQLRQVLTLVDPGAESPQETRTRLLLVNAGLPRPATQIVIPAEWGATFACLDMGWERWRVAVEYDGAQHWTDPSQRSWDIDRAAELQRRGWSIVRVSSDLLNRRPNVLVDRVREALRTAGCPGV